MLILVEKIYGVYGLGIYGVILFLSSIVRYLSLGLSDLFLLRASKCSKSIVKKLYFMYMMLGFTSLIFFLLLSLPFMAIISNYFLKFNIFSGGIILVITLIFIRYLTSINVAMERVKGGVKILNLNYTVPYLFELVFLYFSYKEYLAYYLLAGHIIGHLFINIFFYIKNNLLIGINLRKIYKKIFSSLLKKFIIRSTALMQYSFSIYGSVIILRFFGSSGLSVETFGLLTFLIAIIQALQNLITTVITVNQASLIRLVSSKNILSNNSKNIIDINKIRLVVFLLWFLSLTFIGLIYTQLIIELPYIFLAQAEYIFIALLGVIALELSFFSQISAQVFNFHNRIAKFVISIYIYSIVFLFLISLSLKKIVLLWLIFNLIIVFSLTYLSLKNDKIQRSFNIINIKQQLIFQLIILLYIFVINTGSSSSIIIFFGITMLLIHRQIKRNFDA